jgi:pimeloyl-ACP methyl ester carboxylesterase
MSMRNRVASARELLDVSLPLMERDLRAAVKEWAAAPNQDATPPAQRPNPVIRGLLGGEEKYTSVHAPLLAIFAAPHEIPPAMAKDSAARAKAESEDLARVMPQVEAFRHLVPPARVVVLPNANHYVFRSNEAEVLRDIREFIDGLSRQTPAGQE